jgi:hypothetical protein
MIATLTFRSDGIGQGLYTEAIDLNRLGVLHIERATSIEFDNEGQKWRVRNVSGKALFAATSRQECLDWEQRHFSESPIKSRDKKETSDGTDHTDMEWVRKQ